MTKKVNYKSINIRFGKYVPEQVSSQAIKCIEFHKRFIPNKAPIKEAEELLFAYNSERCRIAQVFYKIARHVAFDEELDGIKIAFKKELFCPDKLKDMQKKALKLRRYFSKRKLFIRTVIAIIATFLGLTAIIGVSTIATHRIVGYIFMGAIFISGVSIIATVYMWCCLDVVEGLLARRLKRLTKDTCIEYFDYMYDKLQFVRSEEDQFLYDVKKGDAKKDNMTYRVADVIYNENEGRALIGGFRSKNNFLTHDVV